ncbi:MULTISPECIES: hypothetical protein [Cyanophyceae]|uniref:hypothetical protein n=1 Tax=Cyanophyceae TaxID=3028117 RepID=UPI0016840FB7|nr:hypothetical protein [Trichocoleus sp. FACHB-40]MBD2005613.1 hypothetical protein [Trichocoleus sp. FACHB-40]
MDIVVNANAMEETYILVRSHINPLDGSVYKTYEWQDTSAPVRINRELYPEIKDLWQIEVIKEDRLYLTCIRTDTPFPWYAYHRFQRDICKLVDFFKYEIGCRLILTAQVWGLAYVPPGEVPNWKHLGKKRWGI